VLATCEALKTDNTAVKNATVIATVNVDGVAYDVEGQPTGKSLVLKTDDAGKVLVKFKLPAKIEVGQANLAVNFSDGANNETLSRSIPIVLKKLKVEFFPEGGDLVVGLPNRVYFQARTTLGKPADLKGAILEDGKPLPVEVATLNDEKEPGVNQGMGRFDITPKAGAKYELRVDSPVGIEEKYTLPALREDGVVLSIADGVVKPDQPIKVAVRAPSRAISWWVCIAAAGCSTRCAWRRARPRPR